MGHLLRQHWLKLVVVFVATALVATPSLAASFLTKRAAKRLFYTKSISDKRFWKTSGNAGTTASSFLGTTDDMPLNFRVNNARALRLEPNSVSPNVIGGFSDNSATSSVAGATISGGGQSAGANAVTDDFGTVAGGRDNRAGDSMGSTTDASYATIGGGAGNRASRLYSLVGGGLTNTASGTYSVVAGGRDNVASSGFAVVGGGRSNTASGGWATVGGGFSNEASFEDATVGGGFQNTASQAYAVVGGGRDNFASGSSATVAGGNGNSASGNETFVGGGASNVASGTWAMIPGGHSNQAAGDLSFAAGRRAKVQDTADGTFAWADGQDFNFTVSGANRFEVRSTGGARFVSSIDSFGDPTTGVELAAGGGSWSAFSDESAKDNVVAVDPEDVLDRVSTLPISTWNYEAQAPSIRHIGPMAQDFYRAFGVGEDERHITAVDADGVALAAIQGLNEKVEALEAQLAETRGTGTGWDPSMIWQALAVIGVALGIAFAGRSLRQIGVV
jgi:hypothetical protein